MPITLTNTSARLVYPCRGHRILPGETLTLDLDQATAEAVRGSPLILDGTLVEGRAKMPAPAKPTEEQILALIQAETSLAALQALAKGERRKAVLEAIAARAEALG